jgi:predicted nucleotidyltransferase
MSEKKWDIYKPLIRKLSEAFGDRLRTVVLFGSRARGERKLKEITTVSFEKLKRTFS